MKPNKILNKILKSECITPLYQPIISLKDGQIYGYEALSRISDNSIEINIEQAFIIADKSEKSWDLEALCRKKALKNAKNMKSKKNLFLNVDPNIIHDTEFKKGFTKSRLKKYGLDCLNIIFEITERTAIKDTELFLDTINHYRKQKYGIAIDDVGAGYSGLNIINEVRPNIMKMDMNLTRNIDKDIIKQYLCKAMVDFGKNAGIKIVVEGIETKKELKTLIKIGVELGQGYFLGIPKETFEDISPKITNMIKKYNKIQS